MSDVFAMPARPLPPLEIARMLESGSSEIDEYLGLQIYANADPAYLAYLQIIYSLRRFYVPFFPHCITTTFQHVMSDTQCSWLQETVTDK